MSKTDLSKESSSKAVQKKEITQAKPSSGIMDEVMSRITHAISHADEAAAAERVDDLRTARPEATPVELVELLIRQKCLQTGAVGAVTSGAAMIPGLGTMVSLTFGVAADIGLTFKMQAELVLEIAAAHGHQLSQAEKRNAVMIVTGISAGANKLLEKGGEQIARQATELLAQKSIAKAIPLLGVAASAGANILSTYIIGQRANAYFSLGPEAVGGWSESIRAITGVDERVIINWLAETTERSWQIISSSAQSAAGAVIVAGQSAGEVIVISAGKVSEIVSGASQGVVQGISSATGTVVETGKWAGATVAATASAAAESTLETGKWMGSGITTRASTATESAVETSKWVGESLAAGAADAGKWVASWFSRGEDKVVPEIDAGTDEANKSPQSDETEEVNPSSAEKEDQSNE